MGYTEYTSYQEINLDFEHICDNCSKHSKILNRFFTTGKSYSSSMFENKHNEAQQSAATASSKQSMQVLSKLSGKNIYIRCEVCGYYSKQDLELIRLTYLQYHKQRKKFTNGCLVWNIFLIAFLISTFFWGANTPESGQVKWAIGGIILIGIIVIFLRRPISERNFEKRISILNNQDIVDEWLKNWNAKGKKLLADFENNSNIKEKMRLCDELIQNRHKGDPFSPDYFFKIYGVDHKYL